MVGVTSADGVKLGLSLAIGTHVAVAQVLEHLGGLLEAGPDELGAVGIRTQSENFSPQLPVAGEQGQPLADGCLLYTSDAADE